MKGIIKFLLNTGVGRELLSLLFRALINLFKKKVLDKMRDNPRATLEETLKIAHDELHSDISQDKVKVKDLL